MRKQKEKKMSYRFVTDKIEVRSLRENDKPRYVVRGTAAIANKKHIYEYIKNKDGSVKTLKSMFTPNFIESMKKQAKSRKISIDTQHELARDAAIKSILKGKLDQEEQTRIENMLKRKMLPLAKLTDIDIKENKLDLEIDFNPLFREVDIDHQKLFDSIWYSLENKYINGVSATFGNFKYAVDEQGDTVIDDGELLGFSLLDGPAEPENNIYEVAIRAIEEGISLRGVEKMEEEKKSLETEKVRIAEEKAKIEKEKKEIEESKKKIDEDAKKAEIEKQKAEQKKIEDELQKKSEELKKAQEDIAKANDDLNRAKGVVSNQKPTGQPTQHSNEFFDKNLKDITSGHDKSVELRRKGIIPTVDRTMEGFGEMVSLQAKVGPTAGLEPEVAAEINKGRLLEKGHSDIITPKLRKGET